MDDLLVAPEVREALASGRGVVALETSAVAHGLPPPRGMEAARRSAAAVRAAGGVPAPVAVIDGRLGPEAVDANVALLEENARVAGEVAAALAPRR